MTTWAEPAPKAPIPGAPFGVGDSAGNIRLNSHGYAAIRWVARRNGYLSRLWIKTRTMTHGGAADSSYYAGTTGRWVVNTYTTTADGEPDLKNLLASEQFVPGVRMQEDSTAMDNPTGEAIGLKLNFPVRCGAEFITLFQNIDSKPSENYASLNFLYSASGLQGAQSRNERDPGATDALYGCDPRELVGGMDQHKWYLPGNNYGPFVKFLPTYVQQYSEGINVGQPYYSAHSLPAGAEVKQRYRIKARHTIVGLGAFLTADDQFTGQIAINGVRRASAALAGKADQFVNARLPEPLQVVEGDVVEITATPGVAGSLKSLYGDSVFERLMGFGEQYAWSYTAEPLRAVPLYPVYQ